MVGPSKRCRARENFTSLSTGLWTNVLYKLPVSR